MPDHADMKHDKIANVVILLCIVLILLSMCDGCRLHTGVSLKVDSKEARK